METNKTEAEKQLVETKVHKDTVLYIIYLLYKLNFLTNQHVRSLLQIMSKEVPSDLLTYLIQEAKSAQ